VKNVKKINILKIFVKNLIGNRRFIRLAILILVFVALSQAFQTAIAADEDEVPDPYPLP